MTNSLRHLPSSTLQELLDSDAANATLLLALLNDGVLEPTPTGET